MNPNDVRALNDAIKELTKALKGGGESGGTPGLPPSSSILGEITGQSGTDLELKKLDERRTRLEGIIELENMSAEARKTLVEELKKKGKDINEQEAALLELAEAGLEVRHAAAELAKEQLGLDEKQTEVLLEHRKIQADLNKQREAAAEYTENMVTSFGHLIGMKAPKKGGIVDVVSSLVSKDKATRQKALEGIAKGLKNMFSPVNMGINLLEKLGELFVYLFMKGDMLGATFARITGQGRELAGASMQVASSFGNVAGKSVDLMKGVADAQNALAGLAGMSRIQASEFGSLATALERVGVSSSDMASIVSQNMVGMGMTARESAQTFANLQEAANQMGMQFGELASSFASNQGSFAAYGHNMTKVFLRTQSTARQLGVELGTLVELGEKFDTFESAAESVADLNYIMGGQFLDTMEMMAIQAEEGPKGVADAIKAQMDATGKNFEDFSYHQRKAMSQALGMSTGEAQKFLSGAIDDTAVSAVENATAPMDKLFQKSNETLGVMDRLAGVMEGLADNLGKSIFGQKFNDMTIILYDGLKALGSPETKKAITDTGRLVGGVSSFIMDAIDSLGNFGTRAMGSISKVVSTLSGYLLFAVDFLSDLMGKSSTFTKTILGGFQRIFGFVAKIFGPFLSFIEIAKDVGQSLGFFADEREQSRAQSRLAGGLLGGVAGGAVGSAVPILGTLYGALMGYSTGALANEKLQGFAPGTDKMTRGGLALVGEKGPEIVTVPPGAGVIPNDAFARGNGPFTGNNITSDSRDVTVHVKLDVNDRKFREMITLNTVDVIEGRGVLA